MPQKLHSNNHKKNQVGRWQLSSLLSRTWRCYSNGILGSTHNRMCHKKYIRSRHRLPPLMYYLPGSALCMYFSRFSLVCLFKRSPAWLKIISVCKGVNYREHLFSFRWKCMSFRARFGCPPGMESSVNVFGKWKTSPHDRCINAPCKTKRALLPLKTEEVTLH